MASAFQGRVLASSNVVGRGTVVIVEVRAGEVRTGARLGIGDTPVSAEVTGIEVFAQDEEDKAEGGLPQLGLLLTGIDKADVPRGCILATEEAQ